MLHHLKWILRWMLFLVGITAYNSIEAQSYSTQLYTTLEGLSDNYIFSVFQDSYGYIWIGTNNGLNRFDGKQFKVYGIQQGLPSMQIDQIYEDRKHRLWIGTRAGMAEMQGDHFQVYPISDGLSIRFVSGFYEPDTSRLWAMTNIGLYELHDQHWEKITLIPGYENTAISKIIQLGQYRYVNFGNRELIRINKQGDTTTVFSSEVRNTIINSLVVAQDTLFASTYAGLLKFTEHQWVPVLKDSLEKRIVYISYRDTKGRWWFGTDSDGVLLAIPGDAGYTFKRFPLSFNLVSRFLEDQDGNLWVAGVQGLLKIQEQPYHILQSPELSAIPFIRKCLVLPSEEILVSGDNGKLYFFAMTPTLQLMLKAIIPLKESWDFIDFWTMDNRNQLWFTTRASRLYCLKEHELHDRTHLIDSRNRILHDLAFDRNSGHLYVCGDSVLYYGTESGLDTFYSAGIKISIPNPRTIRMKEDDHAALVQTLNDGTFMINHSGETLPLGHKYNFKFSYWPGSNQEKHTSKIWVNEAGRGLFQFNWPGDQPPYPVDSINQDDGLTDLQLEDVTEDKTGKLWLATENGVTLLQLNNHKQWEHRSYNIIQNNNQTPLSFSRFFLDTSGQLWMNLKNKLLTFNTRFVTLPPVSTQTVIEEVMLFNQPTEWKTYTDTFEGFRHIPFHPQLRHNENSLSIGFNGLQFTIPSRLEYVYRLEPNDTAWSSPANGNVVTFYKLDPGDYFFEVKSRVPGFKWSAPAHFSFSIENPFWETWWFRLLVLLGAFFIITLVFRLRMHQLRKQAYLQNQLRELELKALKLQMNPHFIHNALNSIQSLIINQKNTDASRYISKFARLLRQVLENAENNSILLDKEISTLQLYVDLEQLRMDMNIKYEVILDEAIDPASIRIPPFILQPFVENALWHGLSRKIGPKHLQLRISRHSDWMLFEITDDGIGRHRASEGYLTFPEGHLSKAIPMVRKRLTEFNRTNIPDPVQYLDHVENGTAKGTTAIVRVFLSQDNK